MVSPQARREAVTVLVTERDFGVTRACGLVQISRSLNRYRSRVGPCAELRARIDAYRPELRGTREAREAARFLLIDPPLPIAARPPYGLLVAAAVSLLPLWARLPLRLPMLPVSERLLVRPGGQLITHAIRWATQPAA